MKLFNWLLCLMIFCLAFTIVTPIHGDEFDAKAAAAAVHVKKLKAHIAELQGELEQAEKVAKGTKATKTAECDCENCTCENCVCGATRYAFNPQKGFHLAKNGNYTRFGSGYRMNQPAMRQASASQMMNFGNCANGNCANGQCNTGNANFFGRRR